MSININEIKKTIKDLDKETLLLLIEALSKIQKKKTKTKAKAKVTRKPTKPVGKKRGRPKKNVAEKEARVVDAELDSLDSENSDDINLEEEQEQEHPIREKPRRIKKLQPRKHGDKGSPGRVEPFQAVKNRPNLFLKSKLFNAHKNDTEIDKKLNAGRKPTERGERNNLVEVECDDCNEVFVVNESLVYNDEEGSHYKCGCAARR